MASCSDEMLDEVCVAEHVVEPMALDVDLPQNEGFITLVCTMGDRPVRVSLTKQECKLSKLVETALECDAECTELPVAGVKPEVFPLLAKYLQHHQGVAPPDMVKPLRDTDLSKCTNAWDAAFIHEISVSRQLLYDLILAANYMDIRPLVELGCAKVASLIKGQPLEKIKGILDPAANPDAKPNAEPELDGHVGSSEPESKSE